MIPARGSTPWASSTNTEGREGDWAGYTIEVARMGRLMWEIPFEIAWIDQRQASSFMVCFFAPNLLGFSAYWVAAKPIRGSFYP